MTTTNQLDELVSNTIAKLKQPGMGVGEAVSVLEDLREFVYYKGPLAGLDTDSLHRLTDALQKALGVDWAYDPAVYDEYAGEGDFAHAPVVNLISTMRDLGLPIIHLRLDEPQGNAAEFLCQKRSLEIVYDPENTSTPTQDITVLEASWIHETLAAQADTDEEPGLYFRLTMPETAWSFTRDEPGFHAGTNEVFFGFGNEFEVRAGLIIKPTSLIREHGDEITVHDVELSVSLSSMLENLSDDIGVELLPATIDRALKMSNVVDLQWITFNRTTLAVTNYVM